MPSSMKKPLLCSAFTGSFPIQQQIHILPSSHILSYLFTEVLPVLLTFLTRFNSSWVLAFLTISACLDSLSTFLLGYLSYFQEVLYTSYMLKFCQKRLIHPTEISFRVLTIELLHETFMNVFYFVVNELLKCG